MDQIKIENLEIFANHGVYPEENRLGQKFLVSCILYVDTRKAGKTDDLEASVNYGTISHLIKEKMEEKNYRPVSYTHLDVYKRQCLNRGCIPAKAMIHASTLYREIKEADRFGISASDVTYDFEKILEYKEQTTGQLVQGVEQLLQANGVTRYYGLSLIHI